MMNKSGCLRGPARGLWAVALALAGSIPAENAVILESFENGIESVTPAAGGTRPGNNEVALSAYTRSGAADANVTEGSKSLRIELSGTELWSMDYTVLLATEASQKLREASLSTNVARYVLRWDIVYPKVGTDGVASWMNSQCFLGGNHDTLQAENGGKRTMSIALDLLQPTDLPAEGDIPLNFSTQFDATEDPFTKPIMFYLDNIRLVDTYAAGAKAVVTPLESFETGTGGAKPFTDWGGTPRTTFTQYTATGAEDPWVTDGQKSLEVAYAGAGGWQADFTLSFANTYLARILKLDQPAEKRPTPAQLARYTLRFDVIFPDKGDDWSGDWLNLRAHTIVDGFPWENARADGIAGRLQPYSITLDQIRWADWLEGKPLLMFVTQGAWGAAGTTLRLDNFRIIDTGTMPVTSFKIVSVTADATKKELTFVWESQVGATYTIAVSSDLTTWNSVLASGIAAANGATTSATVRRPGASPRFYRVMVE